ncbi:MAG: hypothetical protein VZS44_04700 [Bacilli bacterium]|nr:hypothetical protein [Bacilli bacterium]
MIQNNDSNNKIKENKYKILRMSLLLGNGEDREETIRNFEEASREIDAMNDEVYSNDLKEKFYDTLTLEEEEKKLAALVDCIGGRVEQRMSLLEDFANVTGYELTNLPNIEYSERLDEYKNRLSNIREYLNNTKHIEKLRIEVDNLENELNSSYLNKSKTEEQNKRSELDMINRYNLIVSKVEEFKGTNINNAESKLAEIEAVVEESKKSLDIFNKSYATLNQAGITSEEKAEYSSYVESARKAYYTNKELEFLIRLFIIINSKKTEFSQIILKRNSINNLINERLNLRKELEIDKEDILQSIYSLLDRQYEEIYEQKDNIDKIERLNAEIESRKELAKELEKDNQKAEIISLLKEFCLIETNDDELNSIADENIDITNEDITNYIDQDNKEILDDNQLEDFSFEQPNDINVEEETTSEEKIENEPVEDNQVISVTAAEKINVQEAINKSNSVMRRVGEMLGVKIETPPATAENIETPTNQEAQVVEDKPIESTPTETTSTQESELSMPELGPSTTTPEPSIEPDTPIFDDNVATTDTTPPVESAPEEPNVDTTTNSTEDIDLTNNIFLNNNFDADPETNLENPINEQPINTSSSTPENPLFNSEFANKTIDDVMANNQVIEDNQNNDFWFSNEEKPLDLNSLPDIETNPASEDSNSNLFFGNGEANTLDFPNLEEQVVTTEPAESTEKEAA